MPDIAVRHIRICTQSRLGIEAGDELDLGLVTYLDSTGLGALLACRKRAYDEGVRLSVTDASPPIRRRLQVGQLDLEE